VHGPVTVSGRVSEVNATRHLEPQLCNDHSSASRPLPFSHTNFDNRSLSSHNAANLSTPPYHSDICNVFRSAHPQRPTHKAYLSTSCLQLLGSIAIMSTFIQNENCPLLDLPVETLQRITGLLDPHEDLPIVRGTCKTLDHVIFDHFANASFSIIRCCIFSEARWLRAREILGGPSRITSKIRNVEFTTHLFDRREKNELELLLNEDYVENYMDNIDQSEDAKLHEEARAAEVQHLPNLPLMSLVLRDVQTVLPPRVLTLDLIQNLSSSNPYIQAHLDALLTFVFTQAGVRIGNLALNQDASWGMSENFVHLRQYMLRCMSELKTFKLGYGRSDEAYGRGSRVATGKPLDHLYEILRSANELRAQNLNLAMFMHGTTIARRFLESTVSRKLADLTLSEMAVDDKVLLKALSHHAPSLLSLSLKDVTLLDVHEGWSAILRAASTMPRLNCLEFKNLEERHDDFKNPIELDLSWTPGEYREEAPCRLVWKSSRRGLWCTWIGREKL
jgi:hypothetical protein